MIPTPRFARRLAVVAILAAVTVGSTVSAQEPAPVDPAPVDPAPVDPAPVDPAPADVAPLADVPAALTAITGPCVRDTAGATTSCQLFARSGSANVDSSTALPVWVFDDSATDPVDLMNPVLEAFAGDTITIDLDNPATGGVPVSVSLSLPAVVGQPDQVGIAQGGSTSYTFGPLEAGTYLYQAGPTPNGNRQIAMGMAGVLIVRPADYVDPALLDPSAANSAFGGAIAEYGDELVAVTNEFDPRLNANPAGFDMSTFTPSIFTINGKSHEGADPLPDIQAGSKVLLRVANAGLQQRRLGFSGLRHTQWSQNSRLLPTPADVAALTLAPGTVSDAVAMMPVDTGINVALLDEGLSLFNGSGTDVAGQVQVYALPGMGGTAPTVVTDVAANPAVTDGTSLLLDSTVQLDSPGLVLVRYFFDHLTEGDPGVAIVGTDDSELVCNGAQCTLTGWTVDNMELASLSNGEHVVWLQAARFDIADLQSPEGIKWGPVKGAAFSIDREGPVVHSAEIDPALSNGSADLTLRATADTTLTGTGSAVQTVKYSLLPVANADMATIGTVIDLAGDGDNPARQGVEATIPASELAGLGDGVHSVYLYAQDSIGAGNWSQFATSIEFTIDTGLPTVTDGTITPSPNNGTQAYNGSQVFLPVVRLESTITDAAFDVPVTDPPSPVLSRPGSPIVAAEFTFGPAEEPAGTGEPMQSATATWGDNDVDGNIAQKVYADLPLADLRSMPEGDITFWIRGLDGAGNWSDAFPVVFVHDTTAPEIQPLDATTAPGSVLVDVADPLSGAPATNSNVVAVEWFVAGTDPGRGLATPVVLDPLATSYTDLIIDDNGIAFPNGTVIVVRALDAAGNWSSPAEATTGGL